MDLIDSFVGQLATASPYARVALAAECADRVEPIYEEAWVGNYSELVRRSVEIGWAYASGAPVDEAERQRCSIDVRDLLEYYLAEGMDLLGSTVTVVLRVLEAMTADEKASSLAVARGLASAQDTAQAAEAEVNLELPKGSRTRVAMQQEETWQQGALAVIQGWQGVARRDMFDALNDKPPAWLQDWRARRPQ